MSNYHEIQRNTAALIASGNPFWIVFCPTSSRPSTLAYPTVEAAWEGAEFMAKREPDQKFFVMKAEGNAETTRPVIRKQIAEPKKAEPRKVNTKTAIKDRFNIGDIVTGTSCLNDTVTGPIVRVDRRGTDNMAYRVQEEDGAHVWMLNRGLKLAE